MSITAPGVFEAIEKPSRAVALTAGTGWALSSLLGFPAGVGEFFGWLTKVSGFTRLTSWVGKKATEK